MPGWYDIHALDSLQGREDGPGVLASAAYINSLLEKMATADGVPTDRVVMAGFSQGGAMALAMLSQVPGKVSEERRGRRSGEEKREKRAPRLVSHLSRPPSILSLLHLSNSSRASSPCPATCP